MSLFKIFGDYFYTRRIAIYKRKWKFFGTVFILISLFSSLYIAITWVLPQIFATAETSIAKDTDAEFNQGTLSSTEVSGTGTTAVVQLAERAGWYDSNWFYRKPITITNSGSELTDYQVLVTVDTASLISANKMQSDCDDIRFADSSGTELPYWIESGCNSSSTKIWVKVNSIPNGDSTIYLYYGNQSASAASNGDNTFEFFDDFSGASLDISKWTVVSGSAEVSGGILTVKNGYIESVATFSGNLSARGRFKNDVNSGYNAVQQQLVPDTARCQVYLRTIDGRLYLYDTDGTKRYSQAFSAKTWYEIEHRVYETSWKGYVNGVEKASATTTQSGIPLGKIRLSDESYYGQANYGYWDYFILRKYVEPEPSISSPGSEEAILPSSGTWESPTDSNVIDLVYNGGWGDGTDTSTAFSATVANVGANSSIVFQMRVAQTISGLSSASYKTLGVANSGTTFTKTKADLDALGLATGNNRYVQVKITFSSSDGVTNPQLDKFTIYYLSDNTPPKTNASNIVMKKESGGDDVSENGWTNNSAPYFSWTAGADNDGGAGLKGYCLYLGTDAEADPATSKGLLGTSPVSTAGSTCQFIIDATSIDFANTSYRGATWLSSSSDPYYLKIKAIDKAGNIYSGEATSFVFYFDNTPPSNPSGLSAPQGYQSSISSFTIFWPTSGDLAASDSHSGLKGYQYKIGSSGTWYGSSHTGEEDCDDVITGGSYTLDETYDSLSEGENIFYLRTWDNACNVTSTSITAILKYSGSAPTPPQNLTVTPSTNTTNSFAFSWEAPSTYSGQESGLSYCYTINTPPSEATCNWTSDTSLEADAYATQPSTNTFYVVAKDEAGNVNYSAYASVNFTCNTPAPGVPRNVDIADISIKATSNWKLSLSWDEPSDVGAGVSIYKIYRSTTATSCSTDFSSFSYIGSTAGTSYADTGLTQQTYYYCIRACDSAGNCSAVSATVSGYPTGKYTSAASLTSGPDVESVTTKKAVITWSTNRNSDSKVQYGTSSGNYFSEEVYNSTQTTSHSITLSNLKAGTTYYYRAKWTDEDGNTGISDEKSFTTDPPPSVKEVSAKNITLSSAIIQFTSKDATKAKIYYGKTTAFGGAKEINVATTETTYTVELTELDDGTKYYYKVNLFDSENEEYEGDIYSFETLPRPKISGVRIQQVKGTPQPTILVTWRSNTEISSIVTYYPAGKPEEARDEVNVKRVKGEHKMLIRGLLPETPYILVVKGRDKIGNEARSDTQKFTTASDTRPPMISSLTVEGVIQGVGSEATAQLLVSWNTDEPATSQVEFGEGTGTVYSQRTQEDGKLTFNHLVIISNLTPSKVYHLRAISRDKAGNIGRSVDVVSITPKATESASELVIQNLKEVFGF